MPRLWDTVHATMGRRWSASRVLVASPICLCWVAGRIGGRILFEISRDTAEIRRSCETVM
jgi:hypothetical protein